MLGQMNESAFRKGTKRLSNIAKNQEFLKRRTFLEEKDNVIILRLQLDQDQVIEFKFIAFEIGWLDLRTQSTFNKEKFVYITAENITHLISYGYYKDTYFSTLRILKNLNKKLRLSLVSHCRCLTPAQPPFFSFLPCSLAATCEQPQPQEQESAKAAAAVIRTCSDYHPRIREVK